jgi:hypothetical protein
VTLHSACHDYYVAILCDHTQTAATSPADAVATLTGALSLEPVQTLPVALQSWIGKLECRTGSVDNFSFSQEEGHDLIRLLSIASKAVAELVPAHELVHETKDLHDLKAKIRLGEYAGHLFNDLKRHASLGCNLSKRADVISQALKDGDGTVRQALQSSVNALSVLAGEMDFKTACFAIHAYAARNAACHSKPGLRRIARDWEGLAHQIDEGLFGTPRYSSRWRIAASRHLDQDHPMV